MARPKVHVTGAIPEAIETELRAHFELVAQLRGADGVLSLLTTTVDDRYLELAGAQLKVVANYAVGVNNIDLDAARARGIVVTNTPDVLTRATAELAITLTLSLLRRVTEGDRLIRSRRPDSRPVSSADPQPGPWCRFTTTWSIVPLSPLELFIVAVPGTFITCVTVLNDPSAAFAVILAPLGLVRTRLAFVRLMTSRLVTVVLAASAPTL